MEDDSDCKSVENEDDALPFPEQRMGRLRKKRRWDNGRVPYIFSDNLSKLKAFV